MTRRIFVFIFAFLYGSALVPGSLFEKISQAEQATSFDGTWSAFKAALTSDNKEQVASFIQFPIENTLPELMAKDKQEFLTKYSGIFGAAEKASILKAKPNFIAEEGIYNVNYCAKPGKCYLMTFKQPQAGSPYKVIAIGPFGE